MPQNQNGWLKVWTGAMLLIAVGLGIYFTVYVWRRVGKPQTRAGAQLVDNSTEDWAYYNAAAREIGHGGDIYAVPAYQRPERGPGYIYPPLLAFLYQPLAALAPPPDLPGARVSVVLDVLAMAAALGLTARTLLQRATGRAPWEAVLTAAVLAALLSSDKLKGEFQMLQCNGMVALGMALGLYLLDRMPPAAGLALGFAINIKYQALGLVLYLVFRRRWKALGYTAAGTAFWAFLPALSVGFSKDCDYLVRGFSGVLRLVGFKTADNVAQIMPLSAPESTSITSAMARFLEARGNTMSPFVLTALVALVWLLGIALMCRWRRIPVLAWPAAAKQVGAPWSLLAGTEWMAVIASVLAFSPETNSRHLVLTALINVLGVVLVMASQGKARWFAVAGLLIQWMALNLPISSHTAAGTSAVDVWHHVSGPTWGVLAGMGLLFWASLALFREGNRVEDPAPGTRPVPA